jgi:hypothetical protein
VSGKSAHDAVERILDAIDLLRVSGIYTQINNGIKFDGHRKPVNQILLGALHTIHDKNGKKKATHFGMIPSILKTMLKLTSQKIHTRRLNSQRM